MPTMNELNEAVYRGRFDDQMSKGADAAKRSMSALGDAVVTTDEKVRRAEKSFEQIARRYDESAKRTAAIAKATKEYEAAVKSVTHAVETGAKTQAQADEILRRAALVRDAAFDRANAAAEKQKALYAELERLSGRASASYQKWAEVTRTASEAQERFNQLLGVRLPNADETARRAEDVRAYGRALDELRARITPLYAAELQFKDAILQVNQALKVGAITYNEATMASERYRASLESAARAATASSQARFNSLAGITLPDASKTTSRGEDIAAWGRQIDALRAKYVPLEAELQRYERQVLEVRNAEKAGVLTTQEATAARAKLLANYQAAVQGSKAIEVSHRQADRQIHLTSQQLVQLSYQLNDVIAQSAVGTNPFIILAQQGPQVAQALGGWTASFRMLVNAINPATVAAAAFLSAIIIPVAVANANEARLSSMRNALRAFREDYREAAKSISEETRRIALDSPGFGLDEITDAAKVVERVRVLSQLTTPLSELMSLAQDLSKTLDTDLASASERVAKAMRDPATVAKELSENGFPGLTEAVRRQIEVLQRAGERQQAFTLLQQAMNDAVRGAARDVSPLTAAWNDLKKVFSELWEVIRPGLEVVGAGIINWVRNFFGYLSAIRDIIREIAASTNQGRGSTGGPGGAWNSAGGGALPTDLREAIARVESGNRGYGATNQYGFLGRYQFGVEALAQVGMYQMGPSDRDRRGNPVNAWSGSWNFPGVSSREDFLANQAAQDQAYERYIAYLNGIIDRLGLLNDPNARIGGLPVTREALLGVGWARPADMAALARGGTGGVDGNGVTSLERYRMFYRDPANPGGTASAPYGSPVPVTLVPAQGQGQAQIDEMVRRARGEYSGNQQYDTRQNAAANMQGFSAARDQLLAQNEQLRAQMELLEPTSDRWRELNDQLTQNNANIEVLNAGMDGARAALRTTLDPVQELLRGWENSAAGARDSGTGMAFVRDRLRELNDVSMRYRGTSATVEEQQRATSLALQELSEQYRNATAQIDRQIASNQRVVDASSQGTQAMARQEAVERAREEVRKTTLAGTSAEAAAIEELARKYMRLASVEADRATARRSIDREQELESIRREVELIGASADHRARELAVLKERQAILRADPNANLNSDVNQRALRLAEQTASARVEADRLQASFNELANFGARAFDRIGSAITEAFANGSISTIKWGNIARAILSEMIQLAIRLALINPMMNWAFGQNNATAYGAVQALGGMGGGGGLGGMNGLSSIGSSLFSRNLGSGGWWSGFGGLLGGAGYVSAPSIAGMSTEAAMASLPVAPTAATTGLTGGMTIGGASLGAWGGGILGGYMLGSTIGSYVAKTDAQRINSQIGAGGGALAGAAIGTVIFPGVGTVIGGLLGGALGGGGGGLLGPSREFKGGDVGIGVSPDGKFIITGAGGKRWDEAGARQQTQSMLDPINMLLAQSGLSIDPTIGSNWERGSGGRTLGLSGFGQSTHVLGPTELFAMVKPHLRSDNETTMALIRQAFIQSWEDINRTAVYTQSNNANLRTALNSGGIRSVDEMVQVANWLEQIYEPLTKVSEQTSSWNDRIKSISDTYGGAIAMAQRYGLATEELARKQKEATDLFHEEHAFVMRGIRGGLRARGLIADAALTDDQAEKIQLSRQAALIQFDYEAISARKQLEANLKDLYVNIWNPEEYNRLLLEQDQVSAKERLALWKEYEDQLKQIEKNKLEEEKRKLEQAQQSVISVISGLADYAAGLRAGDMSPLSPMGRLDAAQAQFDEVYGKALSGDFKSMSRLQGVSDQYLSLAREVYGGGIGYAQIFDEVAQALDQISQVDEDALTASAMASIMQTNTETLAEEMQRLRETVQKLYTEVRQNNLSPVNAA